jgi:hypothetical protein
MIAMVFKWSPWCRLGVRAIFNQGIGLATTSLHTVSQSRKSLPRHDLASADTIVDGIGSHAWGNRGRGVLRVGESGLWSCARRGISRDLPDGNWCAYTSRVTPHHCCALDSQREGRRDRRQWHLESLAVVCHLCTGSLLWLIRSASIPIQALVGSSPFCSVLYSASLMQPRSFTLLSQLPVCYQQTGIFPSPPLLCLLLMLVGAWIRSDLLCCAGFKKPLQ